VILGIGVDLVTLPRIRAGLARFGPAYARRLLAADEYAGLAASHDPARYLAKRFAAKEAFAKAMGRGLRAPLSLRAVSLAHDPLGKPELRFAPALQTWLDTRGVARSHLSLTDEAEQIIAFVVVES
jgi:holo-[acyl-carrier protein] synthase